MGLAQMSVQGVLLVKPLATDPAYKTGRFSALVVQVAVQVPLVLVALVALVAEESLAKQLFREKL